MAVTVSGKNYSQISSCDSTSAGGTWSAGSQDTANYKEGSASLSNTMKSSGLNTWTFTPTASVDLSGTKHLRIWFLDSAAGLLTSKATGGIQIGVSDGTNTGYWYLGGNDTYEGGWMNFVVNTANAVDTGTKPTAMNAITSIIVRINQSAAGKNFDNVWVDNLCVADGLVVSGDDAGGYFDFEDIYQGDLSTTLGIGIVRKIGGTYLLTGSIDFGLASSATKFKALSQDVVFEDRPVSTSLYGFNVIDDGTNTTEFILGDKVGTAGIQGCKVKIENTSQTAKFYIDGSTDTDVDNFKLYGSTFYGAAQISFPADATNVEILSCNFEYCAQVIASSAEIRQCYFINTSDADAALLWNESIDIANCYFIGNTTGAGIEHPSAAGTPYTYNNIVFSGNTYDVLNSSGSAITVQLSGTSNATTYEGSSVTFSTSVTVTITGLPSGTEVTVVQRGTAVDSGSDGASTANSRNFVTTNSWTTDEHKGEILEITSGADAGRYYVTGNSATTLYLDKALTATASSLTYAIYDENDDTVDYHLESSSGNVSYAYTSGAGTLVDILCFHTNYEDYVLPNYTKPSSNTTLPISLILDNVYSNP